MVSKIQNEDIKTEAELVSAGSDASHLPNASKIYVTSLAKTLDAAITAGDIGGGSGVNYITNGKAETDTTGWATYADAAQNIPVDATGGSATTLTFSRSTSSPLSGAGHFSLVQSASNGQGQGLSYAFTIDRSSQARTLQISFDYNASSNFVASDGITAPKSDGTTTTNAGNSQIQIFVYDVGNSVLIPVSPSVITANGSGYYNWNGTFQTASNSLSYRLCFHVSTATATGNTFLFDNVIVGPQVSSYGAIATDWVAYTPTFTGYGTATGVTFWYKRIGDSIYINGTFTTGSNTATEARISLPTGLTSSDSTKITTIQTAGSFFRNSGGSATASHGGSVLIEQSKTYTTMGSNAAFGSASVDPLLKVNGNDMANSSQISLTYVVPISGWSSTVQMSNDTSSRVVAAIANVTTGASTAATTQFNFETVTTDTHGAVTTGAGAWKFTCPVSGIYFVSVNMYFGATSASPAIWKNGSIHRILNAAVGSSSQGGASALVSCVAGDYLDIRSNSGPLTPTTDGGSVAIANNVHIFRISGPSQIASVDTVAASYHVTSAASTTSSNPINFETADFDTHGAVTTGVGTWKFTCPVSGTYSVSLNYYFGATSGSSALYKNGSIYRILGTSQNGIANGTGTTLVKCVAGDTLAAYPTTTVTPTTSGGSIAIGNNISIVRVGN